MRKETMQLLVSLLGCVLFSIMIFSWFRFIIERDRQLFREELIWYSKYKVVEEMYLNGIPENEIIAKLLLQNFRTENQTNWTEREIQENLQIIKSY